MRALFSTLLISATGLAFTPAPADAPLRGFFPESLRAERDLETRLKGIVDPVHMRDAMQRLSLGTRSIADHIRRSDAAITIPGAV